MSSRPADAAIVITTCPKEENEKMLTVKVTLTSTVVREEIMAVSEKTGADENVEDDAAAVGGEYTRMNGGCRVSSGTAFALVGVRVLYALTRWFFAEYDGWKF